MIKSSRIAVALVSGALLATPFLASAQSGINTNAIKLYSNGIIDVINGIALPVLIAIAFIVFLWGVYKYFILGAANESEKGEGRTWVMWGVVGFVVIFSIWGLVNIVINTFGLQTGGNTIAPPTFNTGAGGGAPTDYASCMAQYNDLNLCGDSFAN
jgi:hypothetical protein